jgi:RNase P subunit RPR2
LYVSIMKDIIKKNAIRADSKFKKLICGNCNNLIFIDENTEIKLQSKIL